MRGSRFVIEVRDITGMTWVSQAHELNSTELRDLHALLKDMATLESFSIDLPGSQVHINPRHIVSAQVLEADR